MWKSKLFDFLYINLGVLLIAVGVYFFKIPNGFSTGGVSGIGTILGKAAPILSPAIWMLLINAVLLFVGFIFLGSETGAKTVYCSLAYSGLIWVFELIIPLKKPLTDQPFLELTYAILLTAIGSAIIFNQFASSGGTDIVALILKKYTKTNVGKALLYTDFLIAFSSFFVFGVKAGLFSMLGLFIKAFLVDGIIESINSYKYFIVVTNKHDEVSAYIMQTLHHGVTSTKAVGEFTGSQKFMIHTVCRRIEAIHLRSRILEIDPHAFTIITTTSEIIGRGFRSV
ncbi:MAG: YitT family protein [Bacillota bacterium]|nr:YitT family protein [Bacillota bacterium]